MSDDIWYEVFTDPWLYVVSAVYVSIAVFCVWFIKGYKRRMALWRARRERQRKARGRNRRQHQVGVEWYEEPMSEVPVTKEKAPKKLQKPKKKSKQKNAPEETVHTANIDPNIPQIVTSEQL